MEKNLPLLKVSQLHAVVNQTLEYAYSSVLVEGEVESFKVNQAKFVFFNLKEGDVSIACFMMVYQLHIPLEDGMRVVVRARPKLTKWSKFSLTVDRIQPQGEGTIKKSFDMLRQKLAAEGLFDTARKRPIPTYPVRVGVIASTESAGYADFMRLINERWGGLQVLVYHTTVQGIEAPDQMITALQYFNAQAQPPDVIVLIRGGGSADDLAAYNDQALVRELAASRIPTLVGVGHEVDTTLSDLVADVRAATPSHAAELLVPQKQVVTKQVQTMIDTLGPRYRQLLEQRVIYVRQLVRQADEQLQRRVAAYRDKVATIARLLTAYDPQKALEQGYAIVTGRIEVGQTITIETRRQQITAEVQQYESK